MQMRMVDQILAPRVENGEETDFGAEMLGIGGDKPQRLCSDMEENDVHDSLILEGDGGNLCRHCKNHVKRRDAEKLRLTILNPLGACQRLTLWTVAIAARVVGVAKMTAPITHLNVTAESSRAAPLDRCHNASLRGRQPCAELLTIGFAIEIGRAHV